jgi:dipeptidyl aminopeptidase/acylaminoacyl peptidase
VALPYKEDGTGYVLGREIHLFLARCRQRRTAPAQQRALRCHELRHLRDGRRIAYVRTRGGRYAHCFDIWVFDCATERHQRVTFDHAMVMSPKWSPDGDRIAFTGAVEEADAESRLWVADLASGAVEELGGAEVDVGDR